MEASSGENLTAVLSAIRGGDPTAAGELLPNVYEELRKLAHARLAGEAKTQSFQTTALVHEAYLRLVGDDGSGSHWANRAHFFAAAAKAMRRILIEHARQRACIKRGGDRERVPLFEGVAIFESDPTQMLQLDEVLCRLEQIDQRKTQVIELRFFASMTVEECATAMGISPRTVELEWRLARAWLFRALSAGDTSAGQDGKS